ncbi:hypothetical protein [Agrococcus sp. ProA11]|uniref:hypothetical protein n=1 Tax=Agrococcus chionoecetis TaxID=3153752 RepID=UPI00326181B8
MTEIELVFAEEEFGSLRDGVLALEQSGELESDAVALRAVQQQTGGPNEMFVVEALLIGGGVLAVAKLLYRWWKEAQPGIVIDQRPGATKNVYRDAAVPGNAIVTFGADGGAATVTVQDEAVDATERIIGKVLDVLAKPVEAIGTTLAEALQGALSGEQAAVSEGETTDGAAAEA